MDTERQYLLAPTASELAYDTCRLRPLRHNEVLNARRERPWRTARVCLILIFWATMAIFLSIIASMLMNHSCPREDIGPTPVVPPVHLSFGPLVS